MRSHKTITKLILANRSFRHQKTGKRFNLWSMFLRLGKKTLPWLADNVPDDTIRQTITDSISQMF